MTRPEIDDLAQRVGAIYCTSCGAPVDIRKDHACPYCRAAFSLIDPHAVVRAMEGYAAASAKAPVASASPVDIGDALVQPWSATAPGPSAGARSAHSPAAAMGMTAPSPEICWRQGWRWCGRW